MTALRNVFIVVGVLSAIAALVFADWERGSLPAAGAACGFGISAGLCMIAAAIVAAGDRNKPPQPGTERSEPER